MAGYYFIVTYLGVLFPQGGIWDWNSLFMFSTDVFGNAWISLGYIFLMTILCVIVLGNLIAARVTKEIRGKVCEFAVKNTESLLQNEVHAFFDITYHLGIYGR